MPLSFSLATTTWAPPTVHIWRRLLPCGTKRRKFVDSDTVPFGSSVVRPPCLLPLPDHHGYKVDITSPFRNTYSSFPFTIQLTVRITTFAVSRLTCILSFPPSYVLYSCTSLASRENYIYNRLILPTIIKFSLIENNSQQFKTITTTFSTRLLLPPYPSITMKFTSSILLLVLPALSLARPSPQTADEATSPPAPCADGERRCDAGNTWSLCIGGRFVPQGVNDADSECTQLQVRGDQSNKSLFDYFDGVKYVGDMGAIDGGIGIASASGEPKEYPLLVGPSMNLTLIVKPVPGNNTFGDESASKNGTATRLRKRQGGNLRCTRVCVCALLSLISCLRLPLLRLLIELPYSRMAPALSATAC